MCGGPVGTNRNDSTPANAPRASVSACALGLLITLLSLAPLAHATPPDPSWIPGLYDDADLDDVVVAVTAAGLAAPDVSRVVSAFIFSTATRLEVTSGPVALSPVPQAPGVRAPPV